MHSELKILIELQQIDRQIAEISSRIEAIPPRIKAIEAQLADFIHTLEDRKKRLAANQHERRELEGDIQAARAKITKHRDQLYEVKTNEQYRAMTKEIEGEEANIRKVEDRILEKMLEVEQLEMHIHEANSRLQSEKARVAEEVRLMQEEGKAAEGERAELETRRHGLAAGLPSGRLDHYERLRKARGGAALAPVKDGFCTGCHVRLRPQAYNDIRNTDQLIACEMCSRILYYEAPADENEAAGRTNEAAPA